MQPQNRLKFIIGSAALSEASLLAFGLLPLPYNIVALFFNGLSLGCMWGVIFSFLEGRRTTDILASIMGVSMALSSGVAKSRGLYALNQLHVSEICMPALVGGLAFPLLCFMGWMMTKFPRPTAADIAAPFRSCHSQRTATLGALQTIYALTAFCFLSPICCLLYNVILKRISLSVSLMWIQFLPGCLPNLIPSLHWYYCPRLPYSLSPAII